MNLPSRILALLLAPLLLTGCRTPKPTIEHVPAIDVAAHRTAALPALETLRQGQFEQAESAAAKLLQQDGSNIYGRLVRGITRYKKTMSQLSTDIRTVMFGALRAGGFNHRYMRSSLAQAEQELGEVQADLAAATHERLHFELCFACWEVDWNHNGRIDDADRWLFAIERDAQGERIPVDDPRRRPTFRFDHGDLFWARAFVSFQRAVLDILLAYKWTEVDKILRALRDKGLTITVRMTQPKLIAAAKQRILEGLELADQARRAYLAETDDDREWIPNPRQKDHPMPLPVDDALYQTWKDVIGDLRRIVAGEHGLSVEELAQLGDHQWKKPPKGLINIGKMLDQPKDITVVLDDLHGIEDAEDVEAALSSILGDYYVREMRASPIIKRLSRMKKEIERGEETLERKLRYLLWLN